MDVVEIKICWLKENIGGEFLPVYQTPGASGMDIRAAVENDIRLESGERILVPTGFALQIPQGYEVQIRPRSGLALKHGITLVNSPGTIDSDYRGEIQLPMINLGKEPFWIRRGERLAQLIVSAVCQVNLHEVAVLDKTFRGKGSFGHTGRS